MRFGKKAWAVVFCALSACQVVSGIAPLDIDPEPDQPDASPGTRVDPIKPAAGSGGSNGGTGATGGSAGDGRDAGPKDAGMDGGDAMPPCERPEGSECNWATECGCEENEHCQARGADAKWTCVKRGKKKLGETCSSADECDEGTCDQRVCRVYCDDASDCDQGQCLPATGEGDKLIKDVKVCWRACQAGSSDACPSGTTCQTREQDGKRASFCIPPANPCPTVENGICDEPVMCAAGTDSVDCSCDKPADVNCDHVSQCGCAQGKSCKLANTSFEPICVERVGTAKSDELCKTHDDCDDGLACTFNPYGSCHKYCADRTDCAGENDICGQVTSGGKDIPGYKICVRGCNDSSPCPANNSCVKREDGNFCEPFVPEIPGGTCNLTLQHGCETMPGTACVATEGTTTCQAHTGQLPRNSACTASSECEAGNVCMLGVCRHYCDDNALSSSSAVEGCVLGGLCTAPLLVGGDKAPFKVCIETCTSDRDCDAGLLCFVGEEGNTVGFCATPTAPCPTNNGVCDEPIPLGTGNCVAGADTADCAGSQ